MINEVAEVLAEISKVRRSVHHRQRVIECERKHLINEQVRIRSRYEDDWLRGLEKLLYIDFQEEAKKIRYKLATSTAPVGPAHAAAMQLGLHHRAKQFAGTY
eukprot:TRINITY_DN41022_c0_g1_i1.p1 TRINITY_DN41022_c0_g1~~TRINITY_DN41022_c0_g1_i1.p1  ORF type:complete len:102 (+),score=24.31 TRINITY_DN41022_c0_g1_i1:140-445(+)